MADEIVAVYRAEVDQYKKAVDELVGKVNKLDKEQGVAAKSSEQMGAVMKKVGGVIAAAFTVDRIVAFGREAVKLAAQAEGVERAFRRIGSPQLLEGLRRATRGTVTDLQLMQNAVKASNFDIPLKNLASLFAFAQARARETGESVDYLVDSIILGIGRKSPLILDNLGISAVQLREKFKGLGAEQQTVGDVAQAVGEIAEDAMRKMGEQADTTADKLAQLNVVIENLQKKGGDNLIKLGLGLAYITGQLEDTNPRMEGFMRALDGIRADRVRDLASGYRDLSDIYLEVEKQLGKVRDLEKELNGLGTNKRERERRTELVTFLIPAEKARLDMLREVFEEEKRRRDAGPTVAKEEIRNVFFLTNAIKALRDELEAEGTTRERIAQILKEIPPLQEELARLLGEETEASKKAREEVEKLAKAEEDRWAALEKIEDDRLQKRLSVDKYIADRTAQGLKDELDAALKNEELLAANAILDAENSIMNEESKAEKIKEINDAMTSEQLRLMNEYHTKLQALEDAGVQAVKDSEEEKKKARQQALQEGIAEFEKYSGAVMSLVRGIMQAQQMAADQELAVLDRNLEQGIISREQYDAERRKILRKQAADEKTANLLEATIATAAAVAKALPNIPLSVLAGVLGAVQIGVIASTPIPQFAEGVIGLQGAGTETSDSIPAFLSRGESVMTAAETKKYRPLLEGIRKGTLDQIIQNTYVRPAVDAALLNGFADIGKSAQLNASFNDMNLLRAIDRHRQSDKDGFTYLATQITSAMKRDKRTSWN